MIIDVHCHIHDREFDDDRGAALGRARAAGVRAVLAMGEDAADNARVLRAAAEHRGDGDGAAVLPCLGLHPTRISPQSADAALEQVIGQIREHAPQLAAVGEVGLDYWHAKEPDERSAQQAVLSRLAELARELDLPLSVHARSAGHHTIALLGECGAQRVCMHAFDGSAKHAVRAQEQHGFFFSVPPSVLRSPQKQKLVRRLPLEALLVETDSPVLGPDPRARNEPANAALVVQEIARLKDCDPDEVIEMTTNNARALFRFAPAQGVLLPAFQP